MRWKLNDDVLTCDTKGGNLSFDMRRFFRVDDGATDGWAMLNDDQKACAINGIKQKIADRAAIGRDMETGASASPEEKFGAMKECADRLMSGGPWNVVAVGTGSAGGILYRAMRALYPNAWADRAAFADYIKRKAVSESERLGKAVSESDVRAGLMGVKKIAREIDRIRQEEGRAIAVDAGGMLQELEQ